MDLDAVSPPYIGEDRISVQLSPQTPRPRAGSPVTVVIDYAATLPQSVVPPLVVAVQPPQGTNGGEYVRRVYRGRAPTSFTFVPALAGEHLIVVRESAHNRWLGRLLVQVSGDDLSGVTSTRR